MTCHIRGKEGCPIHWTLYNIRLSDKDLYTKWYAGMDPDRQRRVDGFRFENDKKLSVAADHLARVAIAEYCGIAPEQICFAADALGKPYAMGLDVHFNVSHSGEYVLCAVDDAPIGVDIQQIRPISAHVMSRVCTPEELAFVWDTTTPQPGTVTDPAVLHRFFQIWTAKEAYLKYLGTGIRTPMHTVQVSQAHCTSHFTDGCAWSIYGEKTPNA